MEQRNNSLIVHLVHVGNISESWADALAVASLFRVTLLTLLRSSVVFQKPLAIFRYK